MLSHSLVRFKQRLQSDLDAWIACAAELLGHRSFSPDTIIVRALRHEETTVRIEFPSALDLLGESLSRNLRCSYRPDLLRKTRTTLPGKHLTRGQRRSQLQDVYQLDTLTGGTIPPQTPILMIDDILTTGATMRAIFRSIREALPTSSIEAFTLTRADYRLPTPAAGEGAGGGSATGRSADVGGETGTLEALKSRIFANTV
jgi:predicted amidophosphoribosyltransferase